MVGKTDYFPHQCGNVAINWFIHLLFQELTLPAVVRSCQDKPKRNKDGTPAGNQKRLVKSLTARGEPPQNLRHSKQERNLPAQGNLRQ